MKGNFKVLDKEIIKKFESKYSFEILDHEKDLIIVKTNIFKFNTVQKISRGFILSVTVDSVKYYFKISNLAINMWDKYFADKYSLFEVQNAINYLKVISEDINKETIDERLKNN